MTRWTDPTGIRWYLTPDGLAVPSVTSVLRGARPQTEAMAMGAIRGSRVHSCIERWLAGQSVSPEVDALPYWEALEPWLRAHVLDVVCTEHTVYGDGYAGTLDAVLRLRSYGLCLVDWKTSRAKSTLGRVGALSQHGPQLGAYARAYHGALDGGIIVSIYPDDRGVVVHQFDLDALEGVTHEEFDPKLTAFWA